MGMFVAGVWKRIRRDGVKLRGSSRTKRLRKKRLKHWDEVYVKYRDEIFMERHGRPFLVWKENDGR